MGADEMCENLERASDAQISTYHLIIFQLERRDEISRSLFRRVRQLLDRCIVTPPELTAIDLWIESPGGDPNAAYKLYLELRSRAKLIRAVVPDFAKSAATLLVLGADEIYMAPAAELGPLDMQISHPLRENVTVSALDVAGSFEFLGQAAIQLLVAGGGSVIASTGLARLEVLRSIAEFAASFMSPAVEKLDPHLVHRATSQLSVAEHYARSIMLARAISDGPSEQEISEVVRKLVSNYPAHGFVISRSEAETLGLPVRPAADHARWEIMKTLHSRSEETGQSRIAVISDSKLQDILRPANIDQEHNEQVSESRARAADSSDSDAEAGEPPAQNEP